METTALEEKVDWLESLFGQFMSQTNYAIRRMERGIENLQEEMRVFKKEMKDFKDEMKDFKDEMRGFKDEMNGFKDRMESEVKRSNKQWGDIANKIGTIVEDIVAPAIPRIAKELFGCEVIEDFVVRRYKTKVNDRSSRREFDVIAVCQDKVILNETKSTPRSSYIEDFTEFLNNKEFFDYFPEYKDKEIIPIFSSLYLPEDVVARLSKNSIYAMGMSDSVMEILNYDQCCSQKTSLKS
jgi:hypothetical protein